MVEILALMGYFISAGRDLGKNIAGYQEHQFAALNIEASVSKQAKSNTSLA